MNIRSYTLTMLVATIIAWAGWSVVLVNFNPSEGGVTVFLIFYCFLFLALLGTFSVLGLWLRQLVNKDRGLVRMMAMESFRQALVLSGVLIAALWLQAMRILTWWNLLLLIILAAVIELVTLIFRRDNHKDLTN
ncbi:MAG: hypothetical protein C3F02_03935 [Parcubacteria group bacterium]|nr:MAG: hypothetical protein C3F02_03935 [Parcubacteria group bacterium]